MSSPTGRPLLVLLVHPSNASARTFPVALRLATLLGNWEVKRPSKLRVPKTFPCWRFDRQRRYSPPNLRLCFWTSIRKLSAAYCVSSVVEFFPPDAPPPSVE